MIRLVKRSVVGLEEAIASMRNPMNSWDKSDSYFTDFEKCSVLDNFVIGPKDLELANKLVAGGSVHCKFRRMINVYVDITAPLYWWKQFDTYKVGTVCNSCSTMHKIHEKPFTVDMFSFDEMNKVSKYYIIVDQIIDTLNHFRGIYLETKDPFAWKAMIELLPESYNQTRTIMINYEVLANIFATRRNHKLTEWHDFCDWINRLPYSELITGTILGGESC